MSTTEQHDATLQKLNLLSMEERQNHLYHICSSKAWCLRVAASFPFYKVEELDKCMKDIWLSLSKEDWLEGFAGHPRIGDKEALRKKYNNDNDDNNSSNKVSSPGWEGNEQSGMDEASEDTIDELALFNTKYEERYGFIFLVCATGKSASEMLDILKNRMNNTVEEEFHIAAGEQSKITSLRLIKMLKEFDMSASSTSRL